VETGGKRKWRGSLVLGKRERDEIFGEEPHVPKRGVNGREEERALEIHSMERGTALEGGHYQKCEKKGSSATRKK